MSYQYDQYLKEHRDNVRKGFGWLKEHLPEYQMIYAKAEHNVMFEHDYSKDSQEEYEAYDNYFYGNNKSFAVVMEFRYAWLHHTHTNKHHWQYWVLHNDDPKEGTMVLEMPDEYVIEMLCDWWAFSWKCGDLTSIFKWYKEHKDYILLGGTTRCSIEIFLMKIEQILKEE